MQISLAEFRSSKNCTRHGGAMILAIIILLITTTISISLTRTLTIRHQRFERNVWKHQAELLAQAALSHTLAKLEEDADFTNETWTVKLDASATETGVSRITVRAGVTERSRVIQIVSHVPDHPTHRSQVTLTHELTAP